jgi:hypothetical protein
MNMADTPDKHCFLRVFEAICDPFRNPGAPAGGILVMPALFIVSVLVQK